LGTILSARENVKISGRVVFGQVFLAVSGFSVVPPLLLGLPEE